jgi:hypothetical protein
MAENSVEPSMPSGKRGSSRKAASFDQERVVRRYLSAVESAKAGRGPKRTSDAIGNRITKVDELLVSADPLSRVHLTQERIELHAEYVRVTNGSSPDQAQLERDFVRVVRSYGDRNGITFAAWRQVGVDAAVLERAGIHKAERKPPPAALRAAEQAATTEAPDAKQPPVEPEQAKQPPAGPEQAKEPMESEASAAPDSTLPEADAPGAAKADDEPTEAVSMDELAALLADASVGASPGASSTQPRLGDELASPGDDTPPPTSRRPPRPAPREGKGSEGNGKA